MLGHARVLVPFAIALSLAGCGVRTSLELFADGSVRPGSDASVRLDGGAFDGGSCRVDAQCDDSLACNGVELCIGGRCTPGTAPVCGDGVDCTRDFCVEGIGCVSRPDDGLCRPGGRCDPSFGCAGRRCTTDAECDDGLGCTGFEVCGPDGLCQSLMPPFCDDGNDCTVDRCVEPDPRCESIPEDGLCGPGLTCDPMRGCVAARCDADADCDDGLFCNGLERCGPEGTCRSGIAVMCEADSFRCTLERCDEGARGACVSTPDSTVCPAGELCSPVPGDPDGCRRIECRREADCDDRSFCNGAERCVMNVCRPGTPIGCASSEECREATCSDAARTCVSQPRSDREICDNGVDDDCDGLRDCDDVDCRATPRCACMPVAPTEMRCDDARDDDCDGLLDCRDPECGMRPICLGREVFCDDGADDEGDGLADCADPDCRTDVRCRDAGIGPIDGGMPPGDGGTTMRELGIAACTNRIDDDRDGRTDCADPDCRPFGPMAECCNGIDDTPGDDTPEDVFTCRCFDDSVCAGVSPFEQVCWTRSSYFVCAPDCRFLGADAWCSMLMVGLPRCDAATGQCVR